MNAYLETERLILRAVKEEDAQGFFELDSDPKVHEFLGNIPVKDSVFRCLICLRKETGIDTKAPKH
jgi:RimJ/RimL family protein N-acetyltransferase